jgi:uroporphyrinogen decarboxylase
VIDTVHKHGAKVWFHSCGYIEPLREDLIEIGVDCWNPFPPNVKGNDHKMLAEWRRGRLVLDGGVDQILMVQGTADQIRKKTQQVLDLFAPDGGLLIGPSQVLTEDMPLENKIAFFETAVRYGK